jgi:hypothetical protein
VGSPAPLPYPGRPRCPAGLWGARASLLTVCHTFFRWDRGLPVSGLGTLQIGRKLNATLTMLGKSVFEGAQLMVLRGS